MRPRTGRAAEQVVELRGRLPVLRGRPDVSRTAPRPARRARGRCTAWPRRRGARPGQRPRRHLGRQRTRAHRRDVLRGPLVGRGRDRAAGTGSRPRPRPEPADVPRGALVDGGRQRGLRALRLLWVGHRPGGRRTPDPVGLRRRTSPGRRTTAAAAPAMVAAPRHHVRVPSAGQRAAGGLLGREARRWAGRRRPSCAGCSGAAQVWVDGS